MTKENKKKEKIDRGQFMSLAWLTATVALVGESLAALGWFIQPVIDGGFGGIVKAGALEEDEEQDHCPCHGSLFDNLGEVTGGPAPRQWIISAFLLKMVKFLSISKKHLSVNQSMFLKQPRLKEKSC